MKGINKIVLVIVLALAVGLLLPMSLASAAPVSKTLPTLHTAGLSLYDEAGNKVILHGTAIDSNAAWMHDGDGADRWTTQDDFKKIANYDGNVVEINQIPWDALMPTSSKIDDTILKKYIDNYMLWASHNDLYIVLSFPTLNDVHVPNWMLHGYTDRYAYEVKFLNVSDSLLNSERQALMNTWLYIAQRYADNPYLILGFINEPYVGNPVLASATQDTLKRLTDNYVGFVQQAITKLRSNGINTLVVVDAAYSGAPYYGSTYFPDVSADNFMWERHAYAAPISEWLTWMNQFLDIAHNVNRPLFLAEYGFYNPQTGFIGHDYTEPGYTWQQILDVQVAYCKSHDLVGWSWHEYPWTYGEWYWYRYGLDGKVTFTQEESAWLLSKVLAPP
ncbi:MAG TPA: cellulase family glycosylhydrolase [Candidatus Sulfotelmatobacter sp.]|nr:cellulase family glycosylhydrolase [Candidatus Sulfotelmatobacter sp.]